MQGLCRARSAARWAVRPLILLSAQDSAQGNLRGLTFALRRRRVSARQSSGTCRLSSSGRTPNITKETGKCWANSTNTADAACPWTQGCRTDNHRAGLEVQLRCFAGRAVRACSAAQTSTRLVVDVPGPLHEEQLPGTEQPLNVYLLTP